MQGTRHVACARYGEFDLCSSMQGFARVSTFCSCTSMGSAPCHLKLQSHQRYLLHLLPVLPCYYTCCSEAQSVSEADGLCAEWRTQRLAECQTTSTQQTPPLGLATWVSVPTTLCSWPPLCRCTPFIFAQSMQPYSYGACCAARTHLH